MEGGRRGWKPIFLCKEILFVSWQFEETGVYLASVSKYIVANQIATKLVGNGKLHCNQQSCLLG